MYRRVDPEENKSFTHQSEWSGSLKDLCKDILNDENKERNRKEWERNVCKVTSYFSISYPGLSVKEKITDFNFLFYKNLLTFHDISVFFSRFLQISVFLCFLYKKIF